MLIVGAFSARYKNWQDTNFVSAKGISMLRKVVRPEQSAVLFKYDALGRRMEKCITKAGSEKVISFAEKKILAEESKWEDDANSSKKPHQKIDFQADYLGTPVGAYDETGNLVWERELDINGKVMPAGKDNYGRTLQDIGEKTFIPFRFQGQYEDEEIGLYYNRFRYYDPETGQYTQQDPIGLAGGNPTLYGYVYNTMEKKLSTYNYGICLFSVDVLQSFLKKEKVRTKKLLAYFQKDENKYIATQKEGVWVPISQINSGQYVVKLDGYDSGFSEEWEQKFQYDGFNIEIQDTLWISDIGSFITFNKADYAGDTIYFTTGDGNIRYSDYKYDVPSGKYLLSVAGYVRKSALEQDHVNSGFLFSLTKVDEFVGYKNPREEQYDFNVARMK